MADRMEAGDASARPCVDPRPLARSRAGYVTASLRLGPALGFWIGLVSLLIAAAHLAQARDLDGQARAIFDSVVNADVLVGGSPTYKGSYTGLFKHFFDLFDPVALRDKPVVLLATGGNDRHALIVDRDNCKLYEPLIADAARQHADLVVLGETLT